jgi:hypothetical protein
MEGARFIGMLHGISRTRMYVVENSSHNIVTRQFSIGDYLSHWKVVETPCSFEELP